MNDRKVQFYCFDGRIWECMAPALDYMTTDQRRERREKNSKRGLNKKD